LGLARSSRAATFHATTLFTGSGAPESRLRRQNPGDPVSAGDRKETLSDGGEDIRQVREYLHPNSEPVIDWFHIPMRLTVLQQQRKAGGPPQTGAEVSKQLESVKHRLWHGHVEEALERLTALIRDLDLMRDHSAAADQLAVGIAEFETYIRNHPESIPNYGERYRQGERISTAFVESTVNQVVSRRFVKRQPVHWTLRGQSKRKHRDPRVPAALGSGTEGDFSTAIARGCCSSLPQGCRRPVSANPFLRL
jgi:hypothetical protein